MFKKTCGFYNNLTNNVTICGFFKFIKLNLSSILFSLIFVYACYAVALIFPGMQIDEEAWTANTSPDFATLYWIGQGRFGLAAFNVVFSPLGNFNPIFYDFIGIFLYFSSSLFFLYCVYQVKKIEFLIIFAFIVLFSATPFSVGELLSFSMFSLQQGLAMLSVTIALYYIVKNFYSRKFIYFCLSFLLIFIANSFYQSFFNVFLTGLLFISLFYFVFYEADIKKILSFLLEGILSAALGVGLYFAIDKILMEHIGLKGGYFSTSYVGYKINAPFYENASIFVSSFKAAIKTILGLYPGMNSLFGCIFLIFSIFIFIYIIKNPKRNIFFALIAGLLVLSPFFTNILLGTPIIIGRMLTAYAPAIACEALFIIILAYKLQKHFRLLIQIIIVTTLAINMFHMNQLFYNGYLSYEDDKKIAKVITDYIKNNGFSIGEKPIIFVGSITTNEYKPLGNPTTASFFSWDNGNNWRIHNFLRTQGYKINNYTLEQFDLNIELHKNMPSWPMEGSLKDTGDVLILKFSEPRSNWYSINRGNY